MKYDEIFAQVSKEQGIPKEVIELAYKSGWKFIKQTIETLPLKEPITEEVFNQYRTNFNIPSIGKLYITYDRVCRMKKRFEYLTSLTK